MHFHFTVKIKQGKRRGDWDCHQNIAYSKNTHTRRAGSGGLCSPSPRHSHLPKKSAVPSAMVPATNTPRAIRVALLAALLVSDTVSPSIRMGWDVLTLNEVWFCSTAVLSGAQLLRSCIHQLSSSSLLFRTSGFCREPFPRHFVLSPSPRKIKHSYKKLSSALPSDQT